MFKSISNSIHLFWISFYNWWFGVMPNAFDERVVYIQRLVDKNKFSELKHRIKHNFLQVEINELALYAIQKGRADVINLLALSDYTPHLDYGELNLLLMAFKSLSTCFNALLRLVFAKSYNKLSQNEQAKVTETLDYIAAKERRLDNNRVADAGLKRKLFIIKRNLVQLLPYKAITLEEDIDLETCVNYLYEIHQEKQRMYQNYGIEVISDDERTRQTQDFIRAIINDSNQSDVRKSLNYFDETISFDDALYDEGYSLLTRVLATPGLKLSTIENIIAMDKSINHEYIEDEKYTFETILVIFNNLRMAIQNDLNIANDIREYAIKAFVYQCQEKEIELSKFNRIQEAEKSFEGLDENQIASAKINYYYYIAASLHFGQKKKVFTQMLTQLFDVTLTKDINVFSNIIYLMPNGTQLGDGDIKQLLRYARKDKAFVLNVLPAILNRLSLKEEDMMAVLKFIKENKETNLAILWFDKYSLYMQKLITESTGFGNSVHDNFEVNDWVRLFTMNMHNQDLLATLYGNYIFALSFNENDLKEDDYNPFVDPDERTLLAHAINLGSDQLALKILEKVSHLVQNIQVSDNVKCLSGVELDRGYKFFLAQTDRVTTEKIIFEIIKQYLQAGRFGFVKVDLEAMQYLSIDLLHQIYGHILENYSNQTALIELLSQRLMKQNLNADLKLLDQVSNYKNAYGAFAKLINANSFFGKWGAEHVQKFISILSQKENARSMFKQYIESHQKLINPLRLESMAGWLSINDHSVFKTMTDSVLDEYILSANAGDGNDDIRHWFNGLTRMSTDVLETFLSHEEYLKKLIMGYQCNDENSQDVVTFIKLCEEHKLDLVNLIKGLNHSDFNLIESLLSNDEELTGYYKEHKLSIYASYLNKNMRETTFDSEIVVDAIKNIQNELDKQTTHNLLKVALSEDHAFEQIQALKVLTLVEHLPQLHLSTFVASQKSQFERLVKISNDAQNNPMIVKMKVFSQLSNALSKNQSIENLSIYALNQSQIDILWCQLVNNLKANKSNAAVNIVYFISQNKHQEGMQQLVSSLLDSLPNYLNKNAFKTFFSILTKDQEYFAKTFLNQHHNVLKTIFTDKVKSKEVAQPALVAIINVIEAHIDNDNQDYDELLSLINKLNIFTTEQRRPIVLERQLLSKVISLESNLEMKQLHMIGFNVKALLNVINTDHADDLVNILKNASLDPNDLFEYLVKERVRWLSDYDFDSLNIEGKLPFAMIMHKQYKSFFLSAIPHIIDHSHDTSLGTLTEWLAFDQIARNILFADNLRAIELDYLRIANILDSAKDYDKKEAMLIKSTLLQYGLEQLQSAIRAPNINKDDIDILNKKISQLQDVINDEYSGDTVAGDEKMCSFIIDQCKTSLINDQPLHTLEAAAIIGALSMSTDGRRLFVNKDLEDMSTFYNKVFNSAVKKYLEVHKACLNMLEGGHVASFDRIEESLDKHLMVFVPSMDNNDQANGYFKHQLEHLDSLLHVITFMLSCYKVSCQPLYEADADCLLKIIEQNGCYNWVKDMESNDILSANSIIINKDFLDDHYYENVDNLNKVAIIRPRVHSQSIFRPSFDDDQENNTVKRKSSIMKLLGLRPSENA